MQFFGNKPNINWLKHKKVAYVFSGTLLACTVVLLTVMGGLKYGIDFAGGTLIQIKFKEAHSINEIRSLIEAAGFSGEMQQFGAPEDVLINIHPKENQSEEASKKVVAALEAKYGGGSFTVQRTETVGPKVGKDLTWKALLSVLYSFIGILIYLAVRFESRFATTAVLALVHDTIITMGALCLFGKEFSLPVLAAILTVIGYSLNDTIVVFDRIREDLRIKRSHALPALVNDAVNETLSRTIITSGLTLLTVISLFLFGGPVLHDFSFTLLVGIGFGTYSSVFIASALLIDWPGNTTQKLSLSIRSK